MKKAYRFVYLLLAVMVVLSLTACGSSGKCVIGETKFDKASIGAGETSTLTVEIKDSEGKTQVNGSVTLKVKVTTDNEGFNIEPLVENAEQVTSPGELQVDLKPGGVLPRTFTYNITAKDVAPGEYTFKVTLNAGDGEQTQEVKLVVN